jgi:hypothetical protein
MKQKNPPSSILSERILFALILLAIFALCILPAVCLGQTVGQFGIPKWTAQGTQTQWVTPQNNKVFGISSSGVLEMATASGGGTFAGLTDVAFTSLVTGQLPRYNAATGDWENFTPNYLSVAADSPFFYGSVEARGINAAYGSLILSSEVDASSWTLDHGGFLSQARQVSAPDADGFLAVTQDTSGRIDLASAGVFGMLPLANIAQSGATSGQALAWNGTAWAPATIAATPGGSSGQVQYNDAGAFGGVSGLTLTSGALSAATIAGGTVTASAPLMSLTQTWNAAGQAFHALDVNITNTASATGSTLQRWRVGGSDIFAISRNTVGGNEASPWRAVLGSDASVGFAPAYSALTVRNAANTDWRGIFAGGFFSNTGGVASASWISAGGLNGTEGDVQISGSGWRGAGLRMRNTGTITWTTGTTSTSAADIIIDIGTASPEASVTANPGSLYLRNNGGTGEMWLKTSGTGNTGWTQVTVP